jgi:gluconokinase
VLRVADPDILFVHLTLEPDDATARVASRDGHFMPSSLVTSQFKDLEPLGPDEAGLPVDGTLSPVEIVARIQAHRLQSRVPPYRP